MTTMTTPTETPLEAPTTRTTLAPAGRGPIQTLGRVPAYLMAGLRWLALCIRSRRHIGFFFMGPRCTVSASGSLRVGRWTHIISDVVMNATGTLEIGENTFCSQGVTISAFDRVVIGSWCGIGEYVSIHDNDHGLEPFDVPVSLRPRTTSPIIIGDNVWLGAKATILRGVTIGDGAVIAANAVVTRDIPAGAIAGGVPAKVLKLRDPAAI